MPTSTEAQSIAWLKMEARRYIDELKERNSYLNFEKRKIDDLLERVNVNVYPEVETLIAYINMEIEKNEEILASILTWKLVEVPLPDDF